ncbi:hypothetical protein F2Q69_00030548 [Brassica cretica]|uniref:Uncharacterized protein n=1 Tax=Brassica cretica TaxID=69181 RepID=A0A8S9S651_BRACR|nr:hypothetical protein F2Q69_00030548 [Brassica cretica]
MSGQGIAFFCFQMGLRWLFISRRCLGSGSFGGVRRNFTWRVLVGVCVLFGYGSSILVLNWFCDHSAADGLRLVYAIFDRKSPFLLIVEAVLMYGSLGSLVIQASQSGASSSFEEKWEFMILPGLTGQFRLSGGSTAAITHIRIFGGRDLDGKAVNRYGNGCDDYLNSWERLVIPCFKEEMILSPSLSLLVVPLSLLAGRESSSELPPFTAAVVHRSQAVAFTTLAVCSQVCCLYRSQPLDGQWEPMTCSRDIHVGVAGSWPGLGSHAEIPRWRWDLYECAIGLRGLG